MCGFFMVIKLLMLKILLDELTGFITATRYDYNYHPSAEEYDNLLSETKRYWTHTFLRNEREKLLSRTTPLEKTLKPLEKRATFERRYFVPKFQYKNIPDKKIKADKQNSFKKPLTNVKSSLEFNYFSNELPKPMLTTSSKVQPSLNLNSQDTGTLKLSTPAKLNVTKILVKPLAKPHISHNLENTFQTTKSNNTGENLPIYFTNPATGIVYAITELGKSHQNFSKSNGTIPIFITKEQYERDIFQLKNNYEQKCKNLRILTTPSTPILRLQKPPASVIPITAAQFTTGFTNSAKPLKKPSSVVVRTELIVKDKGPATARPKRKKKNKIKPKPKPKLKIKKLKPPGHKIVSTTLRPILANQSDGPAIILGTRTSAIKLYKNNEKVATQLEKPNFENIFSENSLTKTRAEEINQHRLSKRSIAEDYNQEREIIFVINNKNKTQQNFEKSAAKILKNVTKILDDNATEQPTEKVQKYFNINKTLKKEQFLREVEKIILKNLQSFQTEKLLKLENSAANPKKDTKHQFNAEDFTNSLKNYKKENKDYNMNQNALARKQLFSKSKKLKSLIFAKNLNKNLFETLNNKKKFQNFNDLENIENKNVTNNFAKQALNRNIFNTNYLKFAQSKNLLKSKFIKKDFKTANISNKQGLKINYNFINKNKIQNKENILTATNKKNKNFFNSPLKLNKSTKSISLDKKSSENKIVSQNNGNNSKTNNFLIKTNTGNYFNQNKENEKPSFARANFKNRMNLTIFKHHINKRSTAALTKFNTTLPNTKKMSQEPLNISNNSATDVKLNKHNLNETNSNNKLYSTNTTKPAQTNNTKLQGNKKKRKKLLKKRKRLAKIKRNHTNPLDTLPRSQKRILKKTKKKVKGKQDEEYYMFDMEGSYEEEEDDDDDEEDDSEEEEYTDDEKDDQVQDEAEDYEQQNDILAYEDDPLTTHTSEAGLSIEDVKEKPSLEKDHEINHSEMAQAVLKPPILDYDNDKDIDLKTQTSYVKKRFRRRPPKVKINKDYDDYNDDDGDNSISSNLGGFFRMIFYPIQMVMGSVLDSFMGKDNSIKDDHPTTQYTSYHKTLKQKQQYSSEDYDEDDDYSDEYDSNEASSSSLSSWFSSWFAFNRRNKKIGSTTAAPIRRKPTKTTSSSWLPSWLTFGANDRISTENAPETEDYDEYDKWFASWFGKLKPKARKRTTTTSTTTQLPHVPILTIVDPMKNPHNWIGILAHHIINHTSTSTANPLKDIWNKVTTTTTENPEIPKIISYDKYQIWRLKPQDDSQVKALEEYKKSEDGIKLQWLKGPSLRGLTDVLVPPKMLIDFQASLTFELIDHEVLIFDVGKAIAYEKTKENYFFTTTQKPKKHQGKKPSPIASMTWNKYYEYDDIIKYLETMRMRFPHLVELIHIGRSYEGRPLIVTKIESREAAAVNSAHYTAHQLNKLRHKKRIGLANAVFIEAGIHGMEWIGPATATWIINELLRIMKKNVSDDQSFIRNTTWYILPVLNPDGYVYTHEFDRFWKKSRSRHISRPSGILNSAMTWLQKKRARERVCFGVDLDRNWHYQWGKRGSSKSVCNEFYAGPTPFSEPETKALSEFLMDYRTQIKLFVSMQSYGQIISYPYKANTTYDSERLDDLLDVAMVGTDGLRKKGSKSRYKIDSSNDLVENRSGCSDAFAAYEVGIPFSYTLQLADNGVHGYLLPSASIETTAKDSFDIITGMLDYI